MSYTRSNLFHDEEIVEEKDLEVELNVGQDAEMEDLMSAEEIKGLMAFEYLLDEESDDFSWFLLLN
jgi:hypothetical protein